MLEDIHVNEKGPHSNYEFPYLATLELLKQVLSLPKGKLLKGVLPNKKKFLQKNFELTVANGKELAIH